MSDENEVILSHDAYITANNINLADLPEDLTAGLTAVNDSIDAYGENPTDDGFKALETSSNDLEAKIKTWHVARQEEIEAANKEAQANIDAKAKADAEANAKADAVATPPVEPTPAPAVEPVPPAAAEPTPTPEPEPKKSDFNLGIFSWD